MKKTRIKPGIWGLVIVALGLITTQALASDGERSGGEQKRKRNHEQSSDMKRGGKSGGPQQWMEKIREKNPEEFDRLMKLREEDPEKFRAEMRDMIHERMKGEKGGPGGHGGMMGQHGMRSPKDRELHELAKKYHDAETSETKAELKTQIESLAVEAFDDSHAQQKKMLT